MAQICHFHTENDCKRPASTYTELIATAIITSQTRRLNTGQIYNNFIENYPYFKNRSDKGWKDIIRSTLSKSDCFVKIYDTTSRLNYWTLHSECDIQTLSRSRKKSRIIRTVEMRKNGLQNPTHKYLVTIAITSSKNRELTVKGISEFIMGKFPFYPKSLKEWKPAIRRVLSRYKCFRRIADQRKPIFWTLHPDSDIKDESDTIKQPKYSGSAINPVGRSDNVENSVGNSSCMYSSVNSSVDNQGLSRNFLGEQIAGSCYHEEVNRNWQQGPGSAFTGSWCCETNRLSGTGALSGQKEYDREGIHIAQYCQDNPGYNGHGIEQKYYCQKVNRQHDLSLAFSDQSQYGHGFENYYCQEILSRQDDVGLVFSEQNQYNGHGFENYYYKEVNRHVDPSSAAFSVQSQY